MGQQSEEEGAQHTSLGGPCVQCDGAGCVNSVYLFVYWFDDFNERSVCRH